MSERVSDHVFVWQNLIATAGFFRCKVCRKSIAAHHIAGGPTLDDRDDGTDQLELDAIALGTRMGFDVFGRPESEGLCCSHQRSDHDDNDRHCVGCDREKLPLCQHRFVPRFIPL